MKRYLALGLAALAVGALLGYLTSIPEENVVFRDLPEFGQLMNDINGYIVSVIENPGILEVDREFREGLRDTLAKSKKIVRDWKGDRILESAASQYDKYFDAILASMDSWDKDTTSRLSLMSRDAWVTLKCYLSRSSSLLAGTR